MGLHCTYNMFALLKQSKLPKFFQVLNELETPESFGQSAIRLLLKLEKQPKT